MNRFLYNHMGSVDDIRSSLALIDPEDLIDAQNDLEILSDSIEDESQNQNRKSVIKLLEAKRSRIARLIQTKFRHAH